MIKPCKHCGKNYDGTKQSRVCIPCQADRHDRQSQEWMNRNPNYPAEYRKRKRLDKG